MHPESGAIMSSLPNYFSNLIDTKGNMLKVSDRMTMTKEIELCGLEYLPQQNSAKDCTARYNA